MIKVEYITDSGGCLSNQLQDFIEENNIKKENIINIFFLDFECYLTYEE